MAKFRIGRFFNRCGISQLRGIGPLLVLRSVFELAFVGRSIYTGIHHARPTRMGMDAVYRFLSSPRSNWRRFLGLLAPMVIKGLFEPLTDEKREKVLILDTTLYGRSRSRCVELLSRVRDHCRGRYLNEFRMLALGWSDGTSFVPVDHAVLSSRKQKNRLQETTKVIDRRTCGARRRKEALTKSTDLIVPMVKRASALFILAQYRLMDSWFSFPSVVRSVMGIIHVICMLKNTSEVFYEIEGQSLTLSQIHRKPRKRRCSWLQKRRYATFLSPNHCSAFSRWPGIGYALTMQHQSNSYSKLSSPP